MAACGACGTTILFGGVKDAGLRFCNAKCRNNGALLSLARQLPPDVSITIAAQAVSAPKTPAAAR
jgi:hypothetical protein